LITATLSRAFEGNKERESIAFRSSFTWSSIRSSVSSASSTGNTLPVPEITVFGPRMAEGDPPKHHVEIALPYQQPALEVIVFGPIEPGLGEGDTPKHRVEVALHAPREQSASEVIFFGPVASRLGEDDLPKHHIEVALSCQHPASKITVFGPVEPGLGTSDLPEHQVEIALPQQQPTPEIAVFGPSFEEDPPQHHVEIPFPYRPAASITAFDKVGQLSEQDLPRRHVEIPLTYQQQPAPKMIVFRPVRQTLLKHHHVEISLPCQSAPKITIFGLAGPEQPKYSLPKHHVEISFPCQHKQLAPNMVVFGPARQGLLENGPLQHHVEIPLPHQPALVMIIVGPVQPKLPEHHHVEMTLPQPNHDDGDDGHAFGFDDNDLPSVAETEQRPTKKAGKRSEAIVNKWIGYLSSQEPFVNFFVLLVTYREAKQRQHQQRQQRNRALATAHACDGGDSLVALGKLSSEFDKVLRQGTQDEGRLFELVKSVHYHHEKLACNTALANFQSFCGKSEYAKVVDAFLHPEGEAKASSHRMGQLAAHVLGTDTPQNKNKLSNDLVEPRKMQQLEGLMPGILAFLPYIDQKQDFGQLLDVLGDGDNLSDDDFEIHGDEDGEELVKPFTQKVHLAEIRAFTNRGIAQLSDTVKSLPYYNEMMQWGQIFKQAVLNGGEMDKFAWEVEVSRAMSKLKRGQRQGLGSPRGKGGGKGKNKKLNMSLAKDVLRSKSRAWFGKNIGTVDTQRRMSCRKSIRGGGAGLGVEEGVEQLLGDENEKENGVN